MMESDLSTLLASVSEAVVIWDYESYNIPANANASSILNAIQVELGRMRCSDPISKDFCNAGSLCIYYKDEDQMNTLLNNFRDSFTNLHKQSAIKSIIVVVSGNINFGNRLSSLKKSGFSLYGFYTIESEDVKKAIKKSSCKWSKLELASVDWIPVIRRDSSCGLGGLYETPLTAPTTEIGTDATARIIIDDSIVEQKTSDQTQDLLACNEASNNLEHSFQFVQGKDIIPLYLQEYLPLIEGINYSNFTCDPNLPDGLLLNPYSGLIAGCPTATMDRMGYIISWKVNGKAEPGHRLPISIRVAAEPIVESKCNDVDDSYEDIYRDFKSLLDDKSFLIHENCQTGYHFETQSLKDCSAADIARLEERLSKRGVAFTRDDIEKKFFVNLDAVLWKLHNNSFDNLIAQKREAQKSITDHVDKALTAIITPVYARYVDEIARKYFNRYSNAGNVHGDKSLEKFLNASKRSNAKLNLEHAETCHKIDARPGACRFHLLHRYEQLASVFLLFPTHYHILDWDLSSLNRFVQNCFIFKDETRNVSEKVANCRNWVAHGSYDEMFHDSFDWMKKLLNLLKVESKTPEFLDQMLIQLKDHKTRFKAFYPAKNSIEDLGRTESRLKVLTDDQWNLVKSIFDLPVGSRQLIEAPAGSGKTLIAIKLCVGKFIRTGSSRILLLTHSRPLVETVLIPGVKDELELNGHIVDAIDGVFKSLSNSSELYVATIDDLITRHVGTSEECVYAYEVLGEVFSTVDKFDFIVIDEGHHVFCGQNNKDLHGHHVFSRQSDWFLEGQHRIPKECVKHVIGWLLLNDSSQLIIFRDSIQAPKGDNEPVYPSNCDLVDKSLLHIIRNPGHVRDVLVPFYSNIDTNVYHETGLVNFYPLLDSRVKGPPIRLYFEQNNADYCSLLSKCLDDLVIQRRINILSNNQ